MSSPKDTVRVVYRPVLEHVLQEKDRVFAGFLLKGFGSSAHVEFSICTEGSDCSAAGFFDILGGSAEMPWM